MVRTNWAIVLLSSVALSAQETRPAGPDAFTANEAGKDLARLVVKAHGGAEAFAAVKALRMKNETTIAMKEKKAFHVHADVLMVFPDKIRNDSETLDFEDTVATHAVSIVTPDVQTQTISSKVAPTPHTQDMAPRTVEGFRAALASNLIYILQQIGSGEYQFAALDGEMIGDLQTRRLVIASHGSTMTLLVDSDGNIVQRRVKTSPDGREAISTYKEWQTVGGLKVPKHTVIVRPGTGDVTEIDATYEINPTIDPHAFDHPGTDQVAPTTQPTQ